MTDVREAIAQTHLDEWASVVASLIRRFGGFEIAEDAANDVVVDHAP